MRIVLVGFMACGKTTVGDLLAKKLNKLQIDLDQAIVEREKLTIPEIFAKFGEDHFRLCEHRALLANIGKDAVITTGGGTPMRDDNAACLINSGAPVILLDAEIQTIVDRIGNDKNHPLANSLDVEGMAKLKASVERSDTTSIVAASLVIQSVIALELAKAICDQFESSSLQRLQEELARYRQECREY